MPDGRARVSSPEKSGQERTPELFPASTPVFFWKSVIFLTFRLDSIMSKAHTLGGLDGPK
jgi:hypothetical protein